jgi:hypothetical protein
MKDFVLDRRTIALIIAAMLVWGVFVVPGGAAWTGVVWVSALALLFVSTAILLFGAARTPTMAQVIRGVESEPKPAPRPRT